MVEYTELSFCDEGKVNFEFIAHTTKKKKLNESCCLHCDIKWI